MLLLGATVPFARTRPVDYEPLKDPNCLCYIDMLEPSTYTVTAGSPDSVTSIKNMASGVAWTEAAATAPEYVANAWRGRPMMKGNGSTRKIFSASETALFSAIGGSSPVWSVVIVAKPLDELNMLFSAANSASNTNGQWRCSESSTGGGRWSIGRTNDVGTIATATSSVDYPDGANTSIATFVSAADTKSYIYAKAAAANPNGGSTITGNFTINRVGLFCMCDLTPDGFASCHIGALLIFNQDFSTLTDKRLNLVSWLARRWEV